MATPIGGQTPGPLNVRMVQGATFSLTHTWRDGSSTLVDLTGYSARLQVRNRKSPHAIVLQDADAGGNLTITLGGAAGTIVYSVTAANTATIQETAHEIKYDYDLEMVSGAGVVIRLLEGEWIVDGKEITR